MIFGLSLSTFTLLHVLISLVGIGSGFVVMFGLLQGKRFDGWTALFLITTALMSISGFGFPFDHLLPSHKMGIISLVVLAFLKVPFLKSLAPTQSEPPFAVAQLAVWPGSSGSASSRPSNSATGRLWLRSKNKSACSVLLIIRATSKGGFHGNLR